MKNRGVLRMKKFTKIISYVLVLCLVVTCMPPIKAHAETEKKSITVTETVTADDDGLLTRQYSDFAGYNGKARTMAISSDSLKHNERFKYKYDIENGVDISHHNGTVNWSKVKADGYDFAIIRMAYRGYGSSGNIVTDNNAIKNLKNAKSAGLDVGVYFFSQATTVTEAKEEANYILKLIKGYDIDLPVVMDYEYTAKDDNGRLWVAKKKGMTDRQRTNACLAFCKTVEAAGYDAMVYADKNMLETDLFADDIDAEYDIWLAHWTNETGYANDYTYWQYTSDGSVNGVPSERVDLNVRYVYAPFRIMSYTSSTVTMEWAPFDGAEGYAVYRKAPGGTYEIVAEIDDPAVTSYKDTGLTTNTNYYYYVSYFKTDEYGEKQLYKTEYPSKSVKTSLVLQKLTAKATAVDAGTVKISWNKEPNAAGYTVQRYNSSKKAYETVKTVTSGNTLSYTNTGRKIGTTYKYRVRAYGKYNGVTKYGSYSDPVSVKTSSSLKKPVLTAKPYSYTTNKLSWKKVPGATGYKVQRYNSSTKKWVTVKTINSGSTISYSNTYLNCSTTYKYRVKATATLSGKTVSSYYSDTKAAKTKGSRIGVVKNGPLNIRTGPGTSYKKLTQVKKGKQITVTGSTKSWYEIKIKVNGKYRTGYALKKYVKLK